MPFVTGADVEAAKARLHPSFVGTDASVNACAQAPSGGRTSWTSFYSAWQGFLAEDETTIAHELAAGGRMDLVEQYGKDLQGWQAQIAAWKCQNLVPAVNPSTWQAPPLLQAGANAAKPATDLVQSITFLAIVGLIGYAAIVYVPPLLAARKAAT